MDVEQGEALQTVSRILFGLGIFCRCYRLVAVPGLLRPASVDLCCTWLGGDFDVARDGPANYFDCSLMRVLVQRYYADELFWPSGCLR